MTTIIIKILEFTNSVDVAVEQQEDIDSTRNEIEVSDKIYQTLINFRTKLGEQNLLL